MVSTLTNGPWDSGAALSVYFNRKGTQPWKLKNWVKTAVGFEETEVK